MATWTPPADAVETSGSWVPPADAVVSQPTPVTTAPVAPSYKPTVFEEATGAVAEPLMKMGSSLIAKPVSEIAGIAAMFSDYLGNKGGDPSGFQKSVQESLTYEPRTALGKSEYNPLNAIPTAVGNAMTAVGSPIKQFMKGDAADSSLRGMAVNAVGEAVPQALGMIGVKNAPLIGKGIKAAGPVVGEVASDVAKNASVNARNALVAASDKDWQASARIDTVKEAQTLPYPPSLNPSMSNPTITNRGEAALTGSNAVDIAMSKANKNKWANNAKADMGLHEEVPLTSEAPFKAVRARAAKPYKEVAKIGRLTPDEAIIGDLSKVQVPDLISDANAAPRVQALVDAAIAKVEKGMTGADALDQIKQLRADAAAINDAKSKGTKVDPSDTAKAKASLEIANTLEALIEKNIPETNPKLLTDFRKARQDIAKSYAYQKATNLDTGYLDPSKLPDSMTGIGATMRKVAANFPDAANVDPTALSRVKTAITRAGPAGSLGFAAGSLVGAPFVGAIIGAGIGEVGGMLNAKRMTKRDYQQKNAVPKDRRIQPIVETPTASGNQVVPYVSPTEIVGDMPYRPNFTAGKVDPNPTFVGPDYQQPQIGMSKGPVGGQMGALRAEDARVRDLSMRQGRAAEAAQAAAEAAVPRKPASGGMLFDLDPITGKLRAADQGVKGATPEIFMGDTGASLKSAAEKAATGQGFRMTAAEKVAWNKTSVDIKSVSSDLAKLTDKQILAKMEDRAWVQNTIDKAQQKAAMFEALERRSQDRLAQSIARIQREKMLDVAEQLQDTLGSRPSSRGYGQGPKTRAFQRGLLTGNE